MPIVGVQADLVTLAQLTLVEDPSLYKSMWSWLMEFPQANFDDFGPKNYGEFLQELSNRQYRGEKVWIACVDGVPAGIIGYASLNPYCGTFHGICFAKQWHGKGVARAAVSKVINELLASGQQKLSASYFRDNQRVHAFLSGLGFKFEGLLTQQTLRGGIPVDLLLDALLKEDWLCRSAVS